MSRHHLANSQIYPGVERDYWVYVPQQYDGSRPACLRVFLQTGTHDLDVVFGNWAIANQDMAAALAYKGYDHQLVIGEGGHSLVHGGAIFPETMRWLWRDYPH